MNRLCELNKHYVILADKLVKKACFKQKCLHDVEHLARSAVIVKIVPHISDPYFRKLNPVFKVQYYDEKFSFNTEHIQFKETKE